jgi:hypothetical protein
VGHNNVARKHLPIHLDQSLFSSELTSNFITTSWHILSFSDLCRLYSTLLFTVPVIVTHSSPLLHKIMSIIKRHFLLQVKTGLFAEHSNQLWNISAVPSWTKINGGLIKMYKAEVSVFLGHSIAQAVSRWLPTAAARVWSNGIYGGQSGAGAGFLRVLQFPLPIFIPPNSPSS